MKSISGLVDYSPDFVDLRLKKKVSSISQE